MMDTSRNIRTILDRLRFRARMRWMRPVVWALLWASLAHLSWLAFKGAQVRLQPDAIATGLPGFVFRLFIRPLQWLAEGFQWGEPGLPPNSTAGKRLKSEASNPSRKAQKARGELAASWSPA